MGMPPTPFWMSSLNTTNIGRIEWGLVVMGCVLDVNITTIYPPVLSFENAIYLDDKILNNISHTMVCVKLSIQTPICAP